MHTGRIVFSQLWDFLPKKQFDGCVRRYRGNHRTKTFSCFDQYLCMAFAQITCRQSFRDIETCLRAMQPKFYHYGIRGNITRNTLANANEHRDWRIYADFARLYTFTQNLSTFITRAKSNFDYRRLYYRQVDKTTGLRCDQTIKFNGYYASQDYPAALRRIGYFDTETDKKFIFLTNNFTLPALTVAQLYKCRWQIEIFFKWIKQYLRIKTFFGTSINAVKTQIWIAISVYVLVAIVKKELEIKLSLGEILQILGIVLFEKVPVTQVLTKTMSQNENNQSHNQLLLFKLQWDSSDITSDKNRRQVDGHQDKAGEKS